MSSGQINHLKYNLIPADHLWFDK